MLPERLIRMEDADAPDLEAMENGGFQHCRILGRAKAVMALWRSLGQNAAYFRHTTETLTGQAWRDAWAAKENGTFTKS